MILKSIEFLDFNKIRTTYQAGEDLTDIYVVTQSEQPRPELYELFSDILTPLLDMVMYPGAARNLMDFSKMPHVYAMSIKHAKDKRWKSKGGIEDLRKARKYLEFLINSLSDTNDVPMPTKEVSEGFWGGDEREHQGIL